MEKILHLLQQVSNSLQEGYSESKDQVYNPRVLTAAKIPFTVAKTHCHNMLQHETLGYKRGGQQPF